MLRTHSLAISLCLIAPTLCAAEPQVLFDGTNTDHFEFRDGAWVIEDEALTCRMEQVKQRNGDTRLKGMGYAWTADEYQDFELKLRYKLSPGANSGVFFRTDPENPVQGGFEIQLSDDHRDVLASKPRGPKRRNGALYDSLGPTAYPAMPVGQWNEMTLVCDGPTVKVAINGVDIIDANIDHWDTPRMNPDGTPNKFKTALKDLPRTGRIGFQNHGQVVWFKDVSIKPL